VNPISFFVCSLLPFFLAPDTFMHKERTVPKYDVAIVGSGFSALATAALLSRKKRKIVILEQGPSINNTFAVIEKSGLIFHPGPSFFFGFEPGGVLREFAVQLGITPRTALATPYQVVLPDKRLTVFAELRKTQDELQREFPQETNSFFKMYKDIERLREQTGKNSLRSFFVHRKSAAQFIRSYQFSPSLNAFFDIQAQFFFQKTLRELSLASFITLCDTPPRNFTDGFYQFCDQLAGIIHRQGGDIRTNESSLELLIKHNHMEGIKTTRGVIEADKYLINVFPAGNRSLVFAGLCENAVPVGMRDHVLYLPEYSRPQEFLSISLQSGVHGSGSLKGVRGLSLLLPPSHGESPDKNMIIDAVQDLIPFLKEYLLFVHEYKPKTGYGLAPAGISFKPLHTYKGMPILAASRNVVIMNDIPEAPLEMVSAAYHLEKIV